MNPLLISNPTNIRYLTGFAGASPTEREAYVLQVDDRIYLFTNPLYREEASDCVTRVANCTAVEISREHPFSRELAAICEKESIQKLDFEEADLTVAEYEKLKNTLQRTTLIHSSQRIETIRQIKRPDEITSIARAATLTDDCYSHVLKLLVPGVFESEIALLIETFCKKHGADTAFSPIVAFGKNTSKPHYAPDGKGAQLREKDIVLLDFGAKVNGYCADMTRMVFLGSPAPRWQTAYDALLRAQTHALELLTDGERNGARIDTETRKGTEGAGLPTYPHSLGHALGLDIHESPRLYRETDTELLPGMVITIEPGVYIDGEFGMRIEDTVQITDTGIEVLTKTPKELFVI
jgi:Xaa-Pro aminopeptidase